MERRIHNPIHERGFADPEARYYEGRYIIYVTHSNPFSHQKNQSCLVSEDLINWTLCEDILDMSAFPYTKGAVWAPTVIERNGKYYYIFADNDIPHLSDVGGLEIAVSDSPTGPFRGYLGHPLVGEFHHGAQPIDAHLFKDDDGTVYLYYGGWGHCNVARMNEEMTGFLPFPDGETFREITPPDYVEGPCMFRRGDTYHFLWSAGDWTKGNYRVNTAVSDHPCGPFTAYHTILETGDSTIANGPGHNGYFYLPETDTYLMVYHRHQNGIPGACARYICIDRMNFDAEGNILPVVMTNECILP